MAVVLLIEYCPSSASGGAEQSTRALCEVLVEEGHQVLIAYKEDGDYLVGKNGAVYSEKLKIELPVLTLKSLTCWVYDSIRLRNFCIKYKVSHVITHVIHAAPLLRFLAKLTKVSTGMMLKWRLTTDKAGLKVKWGMSGVDRHVSVSKYTLDYWLENGVPEKASFVVPEGVRVSSCNRESVWRSGEFHVVFAARLIPQKGLDNLIHALRSVLDSGTQVRLSVAGVFRGIESSNPDPYHRALEDLIQRLALESVVKFVGFVDPIENLLAAADLVVAPSILPEAQPLVVMQSMQVGTPVIATDVGGTRAIFRGHFADFLIAPRDQDSLVSAIRKFFSMNLEERNLLGFEMQKHVVNTFPHRDLLIETAHRLGIH
jgi:glycosyltransferase involved in cell wall biosynthesis